MNDWRIAPAVVADLADWAAMRSRLWPEAADTHEAEVAEALARSDRDALVMIARAPDATAIGFAEATVRHDYVNGCDGSPILFLEGIYVEPATRGRGLGRALVGAVAAWGAARGLAEFASDAAADDSASHAFHHAVGFAETERVVFFRRAIG